MDSGDILTDSQEIWGAARGRPQTLRRGRPLPSAPLARLGAGAGMLIPARGYDGGTHAPARSAGEAPEKILPKIWDAHLKWIKLDILYYNEGVPPQRHALTAFNS